MNELLFFATIVVAFLGILLFFRLWGRAGILAWIAFGAVLTNIEVLKCVDIFGMPLTLGNVLYGSTFLATDILSQFYGGKEARKGVLMGFMALSFMAGLTTLSLKFVPNSADWASPHLEAIFGFIPRILMASVLSFLVSNTLDTYTYEWIGKHTDKLWLRNNGSTMTSQAVDSLLFSWLAFGGTMPNDVVWELVLTTYAVKVIVALCDTPFLYLARRIYNKRQQYGTL